MKHSLAGSDLYLLQWYYYSYIITQNNTVVSVTLKFEGYVKSPDGTGTYEVLHSKGASIEITRSLFEGDVLQITSVRNTPHPAFRKS